MDHVMAPDLFGGESPMVAKSPGKYRSVFIANGYRKAEDERNCSNCGHSFQRSCHRKRYRKCSLVGCSASTATDVSRRMVCSKYKPENGG